MENSTSKQRTSKCREWERQRRNRFNEAIIKLGQIVKKMLKNDPQSDAASGENVQYPKIEIIQKAILCLTTCEEEQTQLKAEVLALQVKLEAKKTPVKKDACIQVSAVVCKKNKNSKYVKLLMLQKSKKKCLKEKSSVAREVSAKNEVENECSQKVVSPKSNIQKVPKLLPLPNNNAKKGIENTYVMLPSTPYISFPQRPILFPTIPPAIVFLDANLQTINKPATIPILNRNNGDMTKTTMVNILPISAYSGPLSATKPKKNNIKAKQSVPRKIMKKNSKPVNSKESIVTKELKILTDEENKNSAAENITPKEISEIEKGIIINKVTNENTFSGHTVTDASVKDLSANKQPDTTNDTTAEPPKITEQNLSNSTLPISSVITQKCNGDQNREMCGNHVTNCPKSEKICSEKDLLLVDKDKENKLPHILETALCDNVVDGGNARLELAEEFLAASPTAAFLMSFPLVSGNRSDSPAEEHHSNVQSNPKDNNSKRNEDAIPQPLYFPKTNDIKAKSTKVTQTIPNIVQKQPEHEKFISTVNVSKELENKVPNLITNSSSENPFLNLTMPSIIPTTCALVDSAFSLEFDCNITKANHLITVGSTNNFFYKNDPLNAAKSSIYSTSNISSGHEFNSIGLYPCAMEKFTGKNKSDFSNMEDSLMKIGPSRLTYDIDLGWSHKGFDFVTCTTTSSTFNKDNILSTAPTQYSTSYNPFNPEFHVPLVANTNRKENVSTKPTTSFPEAITSFYSQPTNLWSDDMTLYSNNNFSKNFTSKHQNFVSTDHSQKNLNLKVTSGKQYDTKIDSATNHMNKPIIEGSTNITEKYTKKSPSKMHINWMTSEIRPMQNNCNTNQVIVKDTYKPIYPQNNVALKKHGHAEGNYFPINMHNFPPQVTQEDFQVWPTARPAGTTEISIEPPPINLPTLVGDLALGPHDRKKNDAINRVLPQSDLQNCNSFFSVTQLMNRSSDAIPTRYQGSHTEVQKSNQNKQNSLNITADQIRKVNRIDTQLRQPCYVFNETKPLNYETMAHFSQSKQKNNKSDKSAKNSKTSYSAEALIRGGPCNQKTQDTTISKFMLPSQKFNDFNVSQDNSVAQVSHFPPLLEYPDNSYTGQQFSGTTLYNSTTNTISNSFYSNFMPGSTNLMAGNYPSGPFQSDFIDYNQSSECNYSNFKYEDLKMKASTSLQDKPVPSQYKGRRDAAATKHKLECSKKEPNKKCNSKRAKISNEVEEWSDTTHLLWQNKTPNKRHPNITEDLSFHNYVGNQIPTSSQYQPEFFNTHLMPSNMQNVGHNMDRSLTSFPPTSRANFNLSTIFPEITMKVQ